MSAQNKSPFFVHLERAKRSTFFASHHRFRSPDFPSFKESHPPFFIPKHPYLKL